MTTPDPNQPPTPDGTQPAPGPDQPPAPVGQPSAAPEHVPGAGYPQGAPGPAGPYGAPVPGPTDPYGYGGAAPGPARPPASPAPGPAYPPPAAGYPQAAPTYVPQAAQGPGPSRGMSITGLVLGVIPCTALIGVVLSIVALVKGRGSADSGSRTMAVIGLVVGALWTVVAIWFGVLFFDIFRTCAELGSGVHYVNGVQYTCNI